MIVAWACKEHFWRGQKLKCCENGTVFEGQEGPFWTANEPLFCATITKNQEEPAGKAMPDILPFAFICVAILCCHSQYSCPRRCYRDTQNQQG